MFYPSMTIKMYWSISSVGFTIALLLLTVNPALAMDIEEIYELALETDHVIRKATAIRAGSQEAVQQSRARFLYTQNSQDRTVHDFTNTVLLNSKPEFASSGYSINITQPLFDYDAIVNNQQAWATHELADVQYNETGHFLVLRVITAYMGVLSAKQGIHYRELEVQALKKQLERMEYRLNLGISAKIDVSEAQAGYDQALANRTSASIRLSITNEALRQITGQLHDNLDPLQVAASFNMPNPSNLTFWIKMAHENNYQLQIAQSQLKLAQIGIKKQGASRFPYLSLIATYNYYNNLALDYAGVELETGSITARLDWDFYQGGLVSSRIRQAKYYKDQVDISLQQQKSLVERQVRDAYYILVGGVNRIGELEQSIKSQKVLLEANKAGYETGARTSFDVLNARTNLYTLRRKLAQARHDHVLHHAILKYRAGMLVVEDLAYINQSLE